MIAATSYIMLSLEQCRDTMVWKILCSGIVGTFTGWSGADNAKA